MESTLLKRYRFTCEVTDDFPLPEEHRIKTMLTWAMSEAGYNVVSIKVEELDEDKSA
jgi:hypothetical protein